MEKVTFDDFKVQIKRWLREEISDIEIDKWCSEHKSDDIVTQAILDTWADFDGKRFSEIP